MSLEKLVRFSLVVGLLTISGLARAEHDALGNYVGKGGPRPPVGSNSDALRRYYGPPPVAPIVAPPYNGLGLSPVEQSRIAQRRRAREYADQLRYLYKTGGTPISAIQTNSPADDALWNLRRPEAMEAFLRVHGERFSSVGDIVREFARSHLNHREPPSISSTSPWRTLGRNPVEAMNNIVNAASGFGPPRGGNVARPLPRITPVGGR